VADQSAPITATLDRTCVHRGSTTELQGLTVHLRKDEPVGYSTQYSDQSNELSNQTYKTGYGYGKGGADGTFRATWVVPANAPPGPAIVSVLARGGQQKLPFTVAAQGGSCP
jgi:hypothetical protein